jgi:hypothetical protein
MAAHNSGSVTAMVFLLENMAVIPKIYKREGARFYHVVPTFIDRQRIPGRRCGRWV